MTHTPQIGDALNDLTGGKIDAHDKAAEANRQRADKRAKPKRAPEPTDDQIADIFAEQHRNDLRYVAAWGKWFEWRDG